MTYTQLFILILIVHFLADFTLQTHEQAINKGTSNKWLWYHVGTYTFVWSIIYFILPLHKDVITIGKYGWVLYIIFIGIPHFCVDWITSRMGKPFWEKKDLHNGFVVIGADQIIHYLCLWFVLKEFITII